MVIAAGSAAIRFAGFPMKSLDHNLAVPPEARRFVLTVDPDRPAAGLERAIVAIGNFDGIHRGHKAVIQRAKAIAEARGLPTALLTFEPHPSDYFGGAGTIFRLTPMAAKAKLAEALGLDGMIVLTFDPTLAGLTAERFVSEVLIRRLAVGGVVAGYDFHFGKMRGGTPAYLVAAGERFGFDVEIVAKIEADAEGTIATASSTATRAALEDGDVARAGKLLGHPYTITGPVVSGQRLGRTLGFPTANIEADPSCRLRHGIYAVRAEVEGVSRPGVASYGRRPTVDDNGAPLLEVFLFDFAGDLYGKEMDVAFIAWLRPELKFDGLEALKARMSKDAAQARAILADS
jgi:riboflavin kinase/FMN adenylyltransferase